MKYGNKGQTDARVIVLMYYDDDAFQVEVWDKGNGIAQFPNDPDIDRIINNLDPIFGFGLFLIKNLVDKVEFNKIDSQGHVVKMIIKKN
jgi:anti-sigma regulatory factor (Ser/Thr protein kinase)